MRPSAKIGVGLLAAATLVTGSIIPASAAETPQLFVSEIAPDHASYDNFEYFELTNTTDSPIDLADYDFAYIYVDGDDTAKDVPLEVSAGTVAPGENVVVWLQYTTDTVDSFAHTEADFRAQWGDANSTYPIVTATGQAGFANGGDRGVRVTGPDGGAVWSFYPAGSVSTTTTAHFQVGASASQPHLASLTAPSPGTVDAAQLDPNAGDPGTDPEPDPDPQPDPGPTPQPDPAVETSIMKITELLPDSSNVGGSDGYEFIEVYNATDSPIDFSDFTVNYLYPNADMTMGNTAVWPAEPGDVVIEPADTLVFWIKNGENQELTAEDFNAKFGTALVAGEDLVEIQSGGMANGSPRGVEIMTNTGVTITRAFYNVTEADDTEPDQGIQYGSTDDHALQQILGLAPASPGVVQFAEQVPAGLMVVDSDGEAPVIVDETADVVTAGEDFDITHRITDDVLTRTVTLELRSSADDGTVTYNLLRGDEDRYTHTISSADVIGKRWFEYRVVAGDGTNERATEWVRVDVSGVDTSPVRVSPAEGEYVRGTTDVVVSTEGPADDVTLSIDGTDVSGDLTPALEGKPVFVFDATSVDAYFQNGVRIGEEVIGIFDERIAEWTTLTWPIDERHLAVGEPLTVSVWAGTKKAPEIDLDENNDDFEIRDLRLVLPDGRTLRPQGYEDAQAILRMGDSAGKLDYLDAVFDVPADAFSSLGHAWDTTAVADGPHTIVASNGDDSLTRTVVVDNTAPEITLTPADGTTPKGGFTIDAEVNDAGIGVATIAATLDGREVTLPLETSTLELEAGEHVLSATARDELGNERTVTSTFTTAVEAPSVELLEPADGATVAPGAELSARVTDPTEDQLSGAFHVGWHLDAADGDVSMAGGTTQWGADPERDDATPGALGAARTSDEFLPYEKFTVPVPEAAGDDYRARIRWSGDANPGARVSLHVRTTDGTWERVDEAVANSPVELEALVAAEGHAVDGEIEVLVQHTDGWAGGNRSTRESAVTPYHGDAVARSDYDFTVGWMSDTQYYNADPANYPHQLAINEFLLEQRDNLNLQYVVHTGDIVDNNEIAEQYPRADAAYRMFDEAGLPYGVLAGNHDVSQATNDYSDYAKWFGAHRFEGNPWYGGSHLDNRGHYDLITAGGIDFLHLYMGWGAGDEQIKWMNEILAKYPERVAIVNLHEYMLTTGGLGALPQRIFDEVIAVNPNVRMVQSGHYHDAFTRVDRFDDDGDGVEERTVTSMLFDYQALPEGGLGYLRLMHFDNEGERVMVRTYSPSLETFNSDDPTLELEHQEFELSYADLGIEPSTKTLTTTSFTVDVLSTIELGAFADVASGSEVTATLPLPMLGQLQWYVVARDEFGGEYLSEVRSLTVQGAPSDDDPTPDPTPTPSPTPDPSPAPTDPGKSDGPGTPDPSAPGTPAPGKRPGLPSTGC